MQHRSISGTRLCAALLLASFAPSADAATLTVGDVGCNHTTVQAAITAAAGAGPHLIKVQTGIYNAQAINVAGKDLTITGGYATCAAAAPTGTSTLSGQGGGNGSVLGITGGGNDVILENLAIIRGDEVSDGTGGGIDFRGDGFLTLRRTVVSQNYAGYGGGINVAPGVAAELRIEAGTIIQLNTAQYSGGGIRLEGNAHLVMNQDDTIVLSNEALGTDPSNGDPVFGFGGGLEVIAPASAEISSPGLGENGVIYSNTARFGGGISINGAENDGVAIVTLSSSVPARPVRIHANRALQNGGGIFLGPYIDLNDTSRTSLLASDFRIDGNRAFEGSAIHAGTDFDGVLVSVGGAVYLGRTASCLPEYGCATITDNVSQNASLQLTTGATVLVDEDGIFSASRIEFRRNTGGQLVHMRGDETETRLDDCLAADNIAHEHLLLQEGGGDGNSLQVSRCTLANNTIGAAQVVSSSHDFILERSIVHQPGKVSLVQGGGARTVSNVIASETASLGGAGIPTLVSAPPRFIDPGHADYHLQAASPAVDFSSPTSGLDLELENRGIELDPVVNRFGPGDLGAYERQEVGNLVLNRGFLQDLRLWDVATPGVSTWVAEGKDSPGAVLISKSPAALSDMVGLSQCIHVPGPGTYRLTAFAYGLGQEFARDIVSIGWKLRPNPGGENCIGTIAAQGVLTFPAASTWAAPTAPEFIEVSGAQWTRNTNIELSLMVREGGLSVSGTTSGYFDGIVLEPAVAPTVLLVDGFE